MIAGEGGVRRELAPAQSLDDLMVIATVTQRWPPLLEAAQSAPIAEQGDRVDVPSYDDFADEFVGTPVVPAIPNSENPSSENPNGENGTDASETLIDSDATADGRGEKGEEESEAETDEMDAVAGGDKGR